MNSPSRFPRRRHPVLSCYSPGVSDLAAIKHELRARMRALRRRLAQETPDAARRAARRLPLDDLPAFDVFAGYRPVGSEFDPGPVLARLGQAGGQLAMPAAEYIGAPLAFRAWSAGEPLASDAAGVPSPLPHANVLAPDLVVAPVLAFDRQGHRLGQGGGHYDRAIANLRASRPVFVIGLAYSGQALDELPAEPHDQRLDAILTEAEYILIGG